MFPSPYSGILFLLEAIGQVELVPYSGFRPLIRGFFFYRAATKELMKKAIGEVSVPLFGDSFFIRKQILDIGEKLLAGFRPLIRGFFFYKGQ